MNELLEAPETDVDSGTAGDATPLSRGCEEFTAWCATAQPSLMRFAMRLTGGDTPASEDLVQETLLRAWRNLALFPGGTIPAGWPQTVMRNLATDAGRRRARQLAGEQIHARTLHASPSDVATAVTDRLAIAGALRRVPRNERDVLTAAYLADQGTAGAAAALGIPHGTAKTRARRGLAALRTQLVTG